MTTPLMGIQQGSFTSSGSPTTLSLVWVPDYMRIVNFTQMNFAGAPSRVKIAEWFTGMTAGSAVAVQNTAGAATDQAISFATGGFTPFDSSVFSPGAFAAVTSVSQANPAVVTTTAPHGLLTGQTVQLSNITNMQQISSMLFTITVTGPSTFTIPLNSAGFAAPGAGGVFRSIQPPPLFAPQRRFITSISQANPGVVVTSENHGYSTGDFVRLVVPAGFGMTQLNGQQVKITVLSATSFSIGLDTSAFTAFAFPISTAVPFTFAQVVPIGEDAFSLLDPKRNVGIKGMTIGSSIVGLAGDVYFWVAYKATT